MRVYIIEMLVDGAGRWEPTVGVSLTRADARRERREWQTDNPDDRFRIAVYERRAEAQP